MKNKNFNQKLSSQNEITKQEEKYFIEIFDNHPSIMLLIEPDTGKIIRANKSAIKFYEYTNKEFQTLKIFDINQLPKEKVFEKMKNAMNNTTNYFLFSHKLANGEIKFVEVHSAPIFYKNKNVLFSTIHNVTEEKINEDMLKLSEESYKNLFNSVTDAIYIQDENGYFVDVNEGAVKMYDYPREYFVGKTPEFLSAPNRNDLNDILLKVKNAFNGKPQKFEFWGLKKNGEIFPKEIVLTKGKYFGKDVVYAIARDISESKKLIKEIQQSNARLKEAQNLIHLGYWELDIIYDIIHWSEEVYNIFNIPQDTIITIEKFLSLVHNDDKKYVIKSINDALYHSKEYNIEHRFVLENGEVRYCVEKGKVEFDSESKPIKMIGTVQDITERKLIELALQESENKFRMLTEKALVGIYIIQDNAFKYLNDAALKIIEYPPEEIINKLGPVDISINEKKKIVQNNIDNRIEGKVKSIQYEDIIITKNGKQKIVDILGTVTTLLNKPAIIGTFIDITERKKYQEEIFNTNQLLQNILNHIPQRIFWKDKDSIYQGANIKFLKDIGLNSFNDLIGKNDYQLYEKGIAENFIEGDKLVINSNQPKLNYEEEQIDLKTKVKKWLRTNKVPLYDQDGKIIGVLGTYEDITEIKEAIDRVRMFLRIIEQSPVNIVITDLEGNIIYTNKEFTKITGYQMEEVLSKNPRIFQSGIHTKEFYKNLWNTISSGKVWEGEFYDRKKDGTNFWEKAIIFPFFDDKSKIVNFVKIGEDITLQKEYEFGLIQAKEKAEELNKLKTNFLANMSHELRTPLVGILGFADILRMELPDNEYKEMADRIKQSSKRLMDTLNLILDLSKIEFDKVEISDEEIKLRLLLQECYEIFKPYADIKNLNINLLINDQKLLINSDERLLKTILDNLINNAIKFTKFGEITIKEEIITKDEVEWIAIEIKDTGIGISKENLSKIFEEFRQVSEGFNRSFEGTGLGLTISKRYIELLGGKIEVESELEKGSTFRILLPYQKINYGNEKDKSYFIIKESITDINGKPNRKILLVEDDDITIELLKLYLKNYCDLDIAKNGDDAIQLAMKNNYNAILMDINLGIGIDGMEVAKTLRQTEKYKKIPIIAVTAYAMAGDKEAFINAGCDYYLSKPFSKIDLLNLLNKALI
ncbi:MAG: hypothetical protein STSR0008_01650 [Ignavibacterium sp.]